MGLYPLTKPQKSVYNMEQYFGGSVANITGSAMFADTVSTHALQGALSKTLEQNDSPRIRIKTQNGMPMQYIGAFTPHKFEIMRFDTESEFENWINALAQTPFSLSGDLYKFFIVYVGNQLGMVMHLHHLTADAWTLNLLVRSVLNNLKGEPAAGYSFLDYLAKEQDYENSERREKDKDYFITNFEQCREPVYLSDKQTKDIASKRLSFTVNEPDAVKIQTFCAEKNISPYSIFMNALAVYIYRIKGTRDFYIGTSVLNRTGKKEKSTAGMYINTVPILFHIDESKSSLENVRESTGSIMGVFRHQKYQYSDLLKDIRAKFGFKEKLYDVTLNYQNAAFPNGVTSVQWHFCGMQGESLNIHINDRQQEGVFHLDYDYQTELFSKQDIERLHGHLLNIIFDMIENPDKKPYELKLLSDGEYQKVVFDFNDTAIDYPKEKCIHQLFEEQVEKTPNAVAVVFEDKEYTYRQINEMADSLAWLLCKKDIGRNDIVAIIAKRNYKIIIAMLAVLKAGGAYMPIDPNYPRERIDFMLDDAKCKTALVLGKTITVDSIDLEDDRVFNSRSVVVENINSPDDLFCTLHTSGSSGTPKGAMLQHKGVINYTFANDALYDSGNCVICFSTFTFDAFTLETILPLIRGKKIVLSNQQEQFSQTGFEKLINNNMGCNIFITPTNFKNYVVNSKELSFLGKINKLCIGGEVFPQELLEILPNSITIFNVYGPTECSMWTSEYPISTEKANISIGKPLANTQIYIIDKHQTPLPIGAVGELCISGDGVGRGYLNRPELTAEKFVPNPFIEGKHMYKTGDLARWREDGNIEYIGRMDNQVKIRGLRIELGEIEAAMQKSEEISQTAVVVRKDETGRQYICAYYMSDNGDGIDETALREELSKTLPQYMIPHFFTRMKQFPTTSSGKTDHKSLPTPDFSQSRSTAEYAPPTTKQEKELVRILETVLGISPIGMDDNFFDLGGDSLKAIEFVANAHHEGINIELQNVFEQSTPAQLIKRINEGERNVMRYQKQDFDAIHWLLELGKHGTGVPLANGSIGDMLITGATGWLGAHVLDEYLSSETGTAYCLVRGKDFPDSQRKLTAALGHYFGDKYRNSERIVAVCGDIRDKITLGKPIHSIVHCAANVKHFGAYQDFHDVNVAGTNNVIELAKEKDALLIHVSTTAVSGNAFDHNLDLPPTVFDETKLYVGQSLDNVYVRSKFEAEVAVLEARLDGLNAVVVRVGNLTNRQTDLKFQKNHSENATLTRLKAIADLGIYPRSLAWHPIEFSPVDDTAKAIIKIAQHYDRVQVIYHAYHEKPALFREFVKALKSAGIKMKPVSMGLFMQELDKAAINPKTAHIYEAFIHEFDLDGGLRMQSNIKLSNQHTMQYIKQTGFNWQDVGRHYLRRYAEYFREIGYFG